MTFTQHHRRHVLIALVGALCLTAPTSAFAVVAADPKAADPAPAASASKIGDTPADFAQPTSTAPARGDTPADYPGATRAPVYDPPAIQVVRPTSTIIRDVPPPVLPIVLSGAALLFAMAAFGVGLGRTGHMPHLRRSH